MIAPLPLRLYRAVSILSRSDHPGAVDAVSTCAEAATRLVMQEDALRALLADKEGAVEQARRALAFDWT